MEVSSYIFSIQKLSILSKPLCNLSETCREFVESVDRMRIARRNDALLPF